MFKKAIFLILLFPGFNTVLAQESDINKSQFSVNLFISANKIIYIETNKIKFQDIENKVSDILRNQPFKLDQTTVYRIFADENLDLGFIMDVNQKMLSAFSENVRTERFLLNTVKLNIDGQNWFDSIDPKDLKAY